MEPGPTTERVKNFAVPLFLCLLLFTVTLAVYWPTVHCDFLNYDDPDYFTSNRHVLTGLTPGNIVWAFTTGYASNWHPLTWLSLMLDAELFGRGPFGPHLTNLLLHAVNTVLLFWLLRRLTAATWRSALVAALFALHPLHVESVAWVTERKDVLSAFFGFLSLWAYARYTQNRSRVEGRESSTGGCLGRSLGSQFRTLDYCLALLFFLLGLMSKPVLVTLPLILLLLDWWPLGRVSRDGWRMTEIADLLMEKIPFFVLSAVSCLVTLVVQQKGGAIAALSSYSLPARVENAFISYARYLGKVFWPTALATPYPPPEHWPSGLVLLAMSSFAALSLAAVRWRQKLPFMPVGWFWFVLMLIPVIGLVQVGDQSMADRYTYLPLIGVFLVLAWVMGELCMNGRLLKSLVILLAVIMLTDCAWRTREQLGYWQNSGTLFRHALAVTKDNYVAENDLGTWLSSQGQMAEAMDCYRQSLKIKPGNVDALYDLGNAFARLGDWDNAIADYRRALEIAPAQADILDNLGFALAAKQQLDDAIICFEAALKLDPDSASAHNNLATVSFRQRHFEEAERQYREALRLTPDNPQIYANLGDTLVRLGRLAEAAKCYQAALQLKPDDMKIKAKLQALSAPAKLTVPAN